MTQIEILKKNIQEAEGIIVGGASGMSAAAVWFQKRCGRSLLSVSYC